MAVAAAEMIFGAFTDIGSLSLHDLEIERRPYHRNCSCALHNLKGTVCANACSRKSNISFPKKQARADHSLVITASKFSSQSSVLDKSSLRTIETEYEARNTDAIL